jgi:hypothetical protein
MHCSQPGAGDCFCTWFLSRPVVSAQRVPASRAPSPQSARSGESARAGTPRTGVLRRYGPTQTARSGESARDGVPRVRIAGRACLA